MAIGIMLRKAKMNHPLRIPAAVFGFACLRYSSNHGRPHTMTTAPNRIKIACQVKNFLRYDLSARTISSLIAMTSVCSRDWLHTPEGLTGPGHLPADQRQCNSRASVGGLVLADAR